MFPKKARLQIINLKDEKVFESIFRTWYSPLAGFGVGTELTLLTEKLYVDLEAASHMLQPLDRFISGTSNDYRFAINFGYNFNSWASVNAGPVLHWYHYNAADELSDFAGRFGRNSFSIRRGSVASQNVGWLSAAVRF